MTQNNPTWLELLMPHDKVLVVSGPHHSSHVLGVVDEITKSSIFVMFNQGSSTPSRKRFVRDTGEAFGDRTRWPAKLLQANATNLSKYDERVRKLAALDRMRKIVWGNLPIDALESIIKIAEQVESAQADARTKRANEHDAQANQ